MKAFIINGKGGAGKDQFVTFVREIMKTKYATPSWKIINVSSVEQVKSIAEKYFGWDGVTKTAEWRKALSDLKDIQTRMCDGPFQYMLGCWAEHLQEDVVMFFHIREPSEIKRFQEAVDAKTIIMRRGEQGNYGNHADDKVEDYHYHIEIENYGDLEDLEKSAENFIKSEIKC